MRRIRNFAAQIVVLLVLLEIRFAHSDCTLPNTEDNVSRLSPTSKQRRVKEKTLVKYACKNGFLYESGDERIICWKGKWKLYQSGQPMETSRAYSIIRCMEKPCQMMEILNGGMEIENNRNVTYICDPGYELEGPQYSKCIRNKRGDFNVELPLSRCNLIRNCTDPGLPSRGIRTGDCCKVGSTLHYECFNGYELVEEKNGDSITCLSNEEWSGAMPRCKPIGEEACPDIPVGKNNLFVNVGEKDVYLPDDEVEVGCKVGYETEEDAEMYLLCEANGVWDSPLPVCKPMAPCSRPSSPSNGQIPKLIENAEKDSFPIDYELALECEDGYVSTTGIYGSRCVGNDIWSNVLNCTRITCSDPGIPENGYRFGTDFYYNSTVTFGCDPFRLIGSPVRTCLETGRWSGYTTVCDTGDSDCLDPGLPVNSRRVGHSFNIGENVTYFCTQGILKGDAKRQCLDGGDDGPYWSGSEIHCELDQEFSDKDDATYALARSLAVVASSSLDSPIAVHRSIGMSRDKGVMPGSDVFFAFDGSGSITNEEFGQMKKFAETFVRKVGISHKYGGVRVAVTVFSKKAHSVVTLNTISVGEVLRLISNMTRSAGGTDINAALNKIGEFAQMSLDGNKSRKKIAFLVTDGIWNEGGDPTISANRLRDPSIYGVELYVIGVGKVNKINLRKIAGSEESHLMYFKNHETVFNVLVKAVARDEEYTVCGFKSLKGNQRKPPPQVIRIVGGETVLTPWPWMASLSRKIKGKNAHQCGGSIIHYQWVLTAAHCFKTPTHDARDPTEWSVRMGTTDLSAKSGWTSGIVNITLHDKYNENDLDYDVALVKLKAPVTYDLFMRPICLPPPLNALPSNTELYNASNMATVIGYGHTEAKEVLDENSKAVDDLQELDVKLQPENVCRRLVNLTGVHVRQPTPRMICAGSGKGGEDSCSGDSGGPLMQLVNSSSGNRTDLRWFLVGTVSWGPGCAQVNQYGYYVYVANIRQWIDRVTGEKFEETVPV